MSLESISVAEKSFWTSLIFLVFLYLFFRRQRLTNTWEFVSGLLLLRRKKKTRFLKFSHRVVLAETPLVPTASVLLKGVRAVGGVWRLQLHQWQTSSVLHDRVVIVVRSSVGTKRVLKARLSRAAGQAFFIYFFPRMHSVICGWQTSSW